MMLRLLIVAGFIVGSVLSDCPADSPFKIGNKACAGGTDQECNIEGETEKGTCAKDVTECCFKTRPQLPQMMCPPSNPYVMYFGAGDCTKDNALCGGAGKCVEQYCCFAKAEQNLGKDPACGKDIRGIECTQDSDCAAGGTGGSCKGPADDQKKYCCYTAMPTLPEAGCSPSIPYSAKAACKADGDCKGDGAKCVNSVCCHAQQCAAGKTVSKTKKTCTDDSACDEETGGTCNVGLGICCYGAAAGKTGGAGGPAGSGAPSAAPICPDDKPFVRSLCVSGSCSVPGDVCHLNYACCFGNDAPAVVNPTGPVPAPAPYPPQPRPVNNCRDLLSECAAKAHLCNHNLYIDFMTRNCPLSCNRCHLTGGTTYPTQVGGQYPYNVGSGNCQDANMNCPQWVANGFCSNDFYSKSLKRNLCGRSCGLC
ncbi:hypothetical protein QR680_011354 [Steinernema hermaphroditum]|uniref:ShKT domain-containing protein n=1 Tax=Steinernema hermaphroditum TaxID=289476 RepID=A0AA39ITG8_9BILA|nr:hypothetical protein QR680_011354 [Steinernema hermaphroditum]